MPAPNLKRFILPCILLVGLVTYLASGAHDYFNWQFLSQHYATIKDFVAERQWSSYFGFLSAYLIAVAFSLPIASLLTLAGGAIFGWPTAALVVVAATAGAGLVFFATRNLFTDILQRRAGPFLSKLEDGFSQNAFFYLLALRLIPTAPFWVVNIVPALTRMGISQFLVATFIGIIPGSCVYVWVGRGFDQVLAAGQTPDFGIVTSPSVFLPLVTLGALSLMPVFVQFRQSSGKSKKKKNEKN